VSTPTNHTWANEDGTPDDLQICLACMTIRDKTGDVTRYLRTEPNATENDWTTLEPGCAADANETKLRAIVARQLGVDAATLKRETSFADDLGADDLDGIEIVMAIEDEFDFQIPDDDVDTLLTFGHVVDYVARRGGR
jgi:acyl carrier protein